VQILKAKAKIPIKLDDATITVREGFKYIIPNELKSTFESSPYFDVEEFLNTKEITEPVDFTGKRILAIRTGGYGDLLFIARSLLEIKKNFKNTYIEFACAPRFSALIKECLYPDIVDEVSFTLLPYPHYEKCDYFVSFEGIIEDNPAAMDTNAFELIAKTKFFIDIGLDHTVPLKIPSKYEEQVGELSKDWGDISVIAMQVKPSAIMRTYPYEYQNQLIKLLGKRGFPTLLLERQSSLDFMFKKNIYDEEAKKYILTPYSDTIKGSLGLSITLVKKCKLLITPDSFLTYVGDSLGIPTLGIFSPIGSMFRVSGLNVYALDTYGDFSCYHCNIHSTSPCHWANDMWSPCLKAIFPEYVEYSVIEILEGGK